MPGKDRLGKMKEIAAGAQAEKEAKAKEEAERRAQEREGKTVERAQVEQELAGATGELERLNGQLAEAEALTEQMAEVPAEARAEFDAELTALRQEAETARARLAELTARKEALDGELGGVPLAPEIEIPAETVPLPVEGEGGIESTPLDFEIARELTDEEQTELKALRADVDRINPSPEDKKKIPEIVQIEKDLTKLGSAPLLEIATDRYVNTALGKEGGDKPLEADRQRVLEKQFGTTDVLDDNLAVFYKDKSGKPFEARRANPAIAVLGEYRNDLRKLAERNRSSNPETAVLQEEQAKKVEALAEKIRLAVQRISQVDAPPRELLQSVRETSTSIAQAESMAKSKVYDTVRKESGGDYEARRQDPKTKYMKELEKLTKELRNKVGLE